MTTDEPTLTRTFPTPPASDAMHVTLLVHDDHDLYSQAVVHFVTLPSQNALVTASAQCQTPGRKNAAVSVTVTNPNPYPVSYRLRFVRSDSDQRGFRRTVRTVTIAADRRVHFRIDKVAAGAHNDIVAKGSDLTDGVSPSFDVATCQVFSPTAVISRKVDAKSRLLITFDCKYCSLNGDVTVAAPGLRTTVYKVYADSHVVGKQSVRLVIPSGRHRIRVYRDRYLMLHQDLIAERRVTGR